MAGEHHLADCTHCAKRFTNIFCNPDYDSAASVNAEKVCASYKKGEHIFKEGTIAHGVFCINKGKIKLSKAGGDGKEQILRLAKTGDPMGYRSLLSGERYNASAICLEPSDVCFIPKDLFMGILKNDSNLSLEVMRMLSNDLKKAEQQVTHLAQKPVRERMAEALLFIKETYGFEEDEKTINASFSREDIANLVGTATETAIRLLSDFNKEGMITLSRKKIIINDHDALIKTAHIFD